MEGDYAAFTSWLASQAQDFAFFEHGYVGALFFYPRAIAKRNKKGIIERGVESFFRCGGEKAGRMRRKVEGLVKLKNRMGWRILKILFLMDEPEDNEDYDNTAIFNQLKIRVVGNAVLVNTRS